jgi:hypothetical protein
VCPRTPFRCKQQSEEALLEAQQQAAKARAAEQRLAELRAYVGEQKRKEETAQGELRVSEVRELTGRVLGMQVSPGLWEGGEQG